MVSPERIVLQFVGVILPLLLALLRWIASDDTEPSSKADQKVPAYLTIVLSVFFISGAILALLSLFQQSTNLFLSLSYIALILGLLVFLALLWRIRDIFKIKIV